ncbi:MAG: hypothetical protein M1816_000871 [Peltula sp. TS41687]|nr:MAG: hypothetical protein M1816_000871 [Peltula sp. TS41687]
MCFGNQEIYTACGCRGEFLETRACPSSLTACDGRIEAGICYHPERVVEVVPHEAGPPRHKFLSFRELEAYYRPRITALREDVRRAERRFVETGQTREALKALWDAALSRLALAERNAECEATMFFLYGEGKGRECPRCGMLHQVVCPVKF